MNEFEMYEHVNLIAYDIKNAIIIGMEKHSNKYYYDTISDFFDSDTPMQYKIIFINADGRAEIDWYLEEYLEKTPLSEIPF